MKRIIVFCLITLLLASCELNQADPASRDLNLDLKSLELLDTGKDVCLELFAEVMQDTVTILAESAERRRDIDFERARAAVKRAEERLAEASRKEDVDFRRAQVSLQRAIARLKVAETR